MTKQNHRIIRLMLMVATMVMLFAMPVQAQASAKSTYKTAVSYYKNGKYKKARKQFKKLKKKANESCVKNMPKKMKSAYLKIVKKYVNGKAGHGDVWAYYLTDIDKDGKAELMVEYGYAEADVTMDVYSFKKGKAKKIGLGHFPHSNFYYDPSGNGMTILSVVDVVREGQLVEEISSMKIKNGKIKINEWGSRITSSTMYLPYKLTAYEPKDYSPLK